MIRKQQVNCAREVHCVDSRTSNDSWKYTSRQIESIIFIRHFDLLTHVHRKS